VRRLELAGTPGYMAPEAILGNADIDRTVDIYAVGCVAYFLLTGERVFGATNMMKVLMQHVQEEPTPPSHRTELQIPREIDEFVLACLRKDPNRRPASAEELLQMASTCKTADLWDQGTARKWWETHLPHLASPAKANTSICDVSAGLTGYLQPDPRCPRDGAATRHQAAVPETSAGSPGRRHATTRFL
jgi:eukaryotic-like serine/threonine-protein kinase